MLGRLLLVATVVAAATAIASLGWAQPARPRLATIGCDAAIEIEPPPTPAGRDVVFDRVVPPREARTTSRRGRWYFAKQGFMVRRGPTAVDIFVAWRWRVFARYGGHVLGCPQWPDEWVPYAAFFRVRRPMCVPLVIRADGKTALVNVPVGPVRCLVE